MPNARSVGRSILGNFKQLDYYLKRSFVLVLIMLSGVYILTVATSLCFINLAKLISFHLSSPLSTAIAICHLYGMPSGSNVKFASISGG